jgi:hypothetical protein
MTLVPLVVLLLALLVYPRGALGWGIGIAYAALTYILAAHFGVPASGRFATALWLLVAVAIMGWVLIRRHAEKRMLAARGRPIDQGMPSGFVTSSGLPWVAAWAGAGLVIAVLGALQLSLNGTPFPAPPWFQFAGGALAFGLAGWAVQRVRPPFARVLGACVLGTVTMMIVLALGAFAVRFPGLRYPGW